jgi:large subunit ribosomal protein L6
MSRIGKRILNIPEKTTATIAAGVFTVKGPLGELTRTFKPEVEIKIAGNEITLAPTRNSLELQALWGTYSAHILNMLNGVNKVFEKKLIVEGIGFKSDVKGKSLDMALGFSHPVNMIIPDGLKVTAEKNIITVSGIDVEKVGQFVAQVRAMKKPEPYKGKGIRYDGEVIRRKQGKKSA